MISDGVLCVLFWGDHHLSSDCGVLGLGCGTFQESVCIMN